MFTRHYHMLCFTDKELPMYLELYKNILFYVFTAIQYIRFKIGK